MKIVAVIEMQLKKHQSTKKQNLALARKKPMMSLIGLKGKNRIKMRMEKILQKDCWRRDSEKMLSTKQDQDLITIK